MSKPARFVLNTAKGIHGGTISEGMIKKGIQNIRENGVADTLHKVYRKLRNADVYSEWMKAPLFTDAEISEQRSHVFSKDIVFSITVPLYNTPEAFLREMIGSSTSRKCCISGARIRIQSLRGSRQKTTRQFQEGRLY